MADYQLKKELGNSAFQQNKYFEARDRYREAISLCDPNNKEALSVLQTNLATTEMRLDDPSAAIQSASLAIEINPGNAKAYLRRGEAYFTTSSFLDSYNDFLAAAKLFPNEKYYRERMESAKKAYNSKRLMEAMYREEEQPHNYEPIEIPAFNNQFAVQLHVDLKKDIKPKIQVFQKMLEDIKKINRELPNFVDISHKGTLYVVGDTHGQLQDVINIFETFGYPSSSTPYLFNGDYVDRGSQGVEILALLFAWKLADPSSIYLNRGNQYV